MAVAVLATGALLASLVATHFTVRTLRARGILDIPNIRSLHSNPVPRGGGIGPALVCLCLLPFLPDVSYELKLGLLSGAGFFALLGAAEDFRGVEVKVRLLTQLAIAFATGFILLEPQGLALRVLLGGLAAAWLVSYVNAFNFMDGINGISVVQVVVAGGTWAVIGEVEQVPELTSAGLLVAAAALGFSPFNFPAARTFLGDVGSYFFGAWLGVLAVWAVASGIPPEAMFGPLVLYLADTGTTLVRRIIRGEEWMTPHRDHAYQRLVGLGWSHGRVDALVLTVMMVCSALGAASLFVGPPLRIAAGLALLAAVGAYLALPKVLAR